MTRPIYRGRGRGAAAKVFSLRLDDETRDALELEAKRLNGERPDWQRQAGPAEVARRVLAEWAKTPLFRPASSPDVSVSALEREIAKLREDLDAKDNRIGELIAESGLAGLQAESDVVALRAEVERLRKAVTYSQENGRAEKKRAKRLERANATLAAKLKKGGASA